MNRMRRTVFASAFTLAGVLGAGVALAAPASAAGQSSSHAPYNGVCGAGFKVIDSWEATALGTAYLTWNESTGENCAVTIRTAPGARMHMVAGISQTDHPEVAALDSGSYTSYAGPVRIPARGECVTWRAEIGDQVLDATGHCG